MKRKLSILLFTACMSTRAFAQDARGAMNQILDGYTLPIL